MRDDMDLLQSADREASGENNMQPKVLAAPAGPAVVQPAAAAFNIEEIVRAVVGMLDARERNQEGETFAFTRNRIRLW